MSFAPQSIAIAIKSASLHFDKLATDLVATVGLTPAQFRILKVLMKSPPSSLRQVDIERIFNMSNPTVTGLVNTLEKHGFIRRIPNPNDSRSKVIEITEKSEAMREQFIAIGEQIERDFTACLTEKEKQAILPILKKLANHAN